MTDHDGAAAVVLSRYTQDVVYRAMARLPDAQREVLVRRVLHRKTISEVAVALGRSRGAVKQLQHRAVRNLDRLVVALEPGQALHFPTS